MSDDVMRQPEGCRLRFGLKEVPSEVNAAAICGIQYRSCYTTQDVARFNQRTGLPAYEFIRKRVADLLGGDPIIAGVRSVKA